MLFIRLLGKRWFSKTYPAHQVVKLPALSPTMTQGNIGTWKKKIGQEINPGDPLVEIETDKAQMDFEYQEEGFLAKILLKEGTKDVPVGEPIAIIAEEKDSIDQFKDYSIAQDVKEEKKTENIAKKEIIIDNEVKTDAVNVDKPEAKTDKVNDLSKTDRIFASPIAKNIAKESGIDLSNIQGSGPNGRIIKSDVLNFASTPQPQSTLFKDIPLSNVRKVIAARLTESKQNIPHYYLTMAVQMEKIMELRERFNAQLKENGIKLSVNDFILKAVAAACAKVPEANSSWQGSFIRQYSSVDISVAVATPTGLITPIVTGVQDRGLISISQKVRELADLARENKLKPEQFQGGTFTVSNLGMFGITNFVAIINPPQSCILAVGAIQKDNSMNVSLSCDHRVVDGAIGAQWLSHFKTFMEDPVKIIL